MTIFNWVQKKLHQNVIKDSVTKNEKKKRSEGRSEIEKNTKAILDQVDLVDAFDNWFDGVLTIGTFGFDTLKFQEEEEKYEDECESGGLDYVVIDGSIIKDVNQELDPLISNDNMVYDHHDDLLVLDIDMFDPVKTVESPVVKAEVESEIEPQKKRTTLRELFMENVDDDKKKPKKPNHDDDVAEHGELKYDKQNESKLTSKFAFGKKKKKMVFSKSKDNDGDSNLIKKVHDSRPIKKMSQMVKRMLKKKIHPDHVDATKAFKKDVPNKPTLKFEAPELLYLLNIQDCMV